MPKYIKYTYIRKVISNIMGKQKTVVKKITKKEKKIIKERSINTKFTEYPKINNFVQLEKIVKESLDEKPHGHFEGVNWVWPNGQRTHVRFLDLAIRQMRPLPRGFYEEAEKETYLTNVKNMLRKAKQLKLPADVDRETK